MGLHVVHFFLRLAFRNISNAPNFTGAVIITPWYENITLVESRIYVNGEGRLNEYNKNAYKYMGRRRRIVKCVTNSVFTIVILLLYKILCTRNSSYN